MSFNPLQNYNQGFAVATQQRENDFQKSEEARLREQRQAFVDAKDKGEALKQLKVDQPKVWQAFKNEMKTDDVGMDALADDSAMVLYQLGIDPSGDSARQFLSHRIEMGQSQGRDMWHSQQALNTLNRNNGAETLAGNMKQFIDLPNQLKGQKQTNFAPEISPVQTDPETGQKFIIRTDKNSGEVKRINADGATGESVGSQEKRLIRRELIKDATAESKEAFKGLKNIKSNLGTIDEAITAIDKGASSGVLQSFFPSFTQATIELENTANRMGLDVVSATTFGALSEGELKLAMNTAMPTNLEPKALKDWLVKRKKAQQKLGRELRSMALTLGKGKTTIAEYLEGSATFNDKLENEEQTTDEASIYSKYGIQ